jgi:hypothetical protein
VAGARTRPPTIDTVEKNAVAGTVTNQNQAVLSTESVSSSEVIETRRRGLTDRAALVHPFDSRSLGDPAHSGQSDAELSLEGLTHCGREAGSEGRKELVVLSATHR